jgi:nucleoid DNA-binding protein
MGTVAKATGQKYSSRMIQREVRQRLHGKIKITAPQVQAVLDVYADVIRDLLLGGNAIIPLIGVGQFQSLPRKATRPYSSKEGGYLVVPAHKQPSFLFRREYRWNMRNLTLESPIRPWVRPVRLTESLEPTELTKSPELTESIELTES